MRMEAERRFGAWGVGRRVGQAMTGRRLGPLRLDLKRVGRQRIERAFAWVLLLLLPAAAGVLSPPLAGQAADPLMVVVNPRNAAAVSMSKSELKKILLGDQTNWPNGSAIVLVLPAAGNPDRTRVLPALRAERRWLSRKLDRRLRSRARCGQTQRQWGSCTNTTWMSR